MAQTEGVGHGERDREGMNEREREFRLHGVPEMAEIPRLRPGEGVVL